MLRTGSSEHRRLPKTKWFLMLVRAPSRLLAAHWIARKHCCGTDRWAPLRLRLLTVEPTLLPEQLPNGPGKANCCLLQAAVTPWQPWRMQVSQTTLVMFRLRVGHFWNGLRDGRFPASLRSN